MRKTFLVLFLFYSAWAWTGETPRFWTDDVRWTEIVSKAPILSLDQKEEMLEEKGLGKIEFVGTYPPLFPVTCTFHATGYWKPDIQGCAELPMRPGSLWHVRRCNAVCATLTVAYQCEDADLCI